MIGTKTIQHVHQTLQNARDYLQKIETEFLLVEGIQKTEFYSVMLIDVTVGNYPVRQQRVVTITFYKCDKRPLQKRWS